MTNKLPSIDSATLLFPDVVMGALGDVFKLGRSVSVNPGMSQATIQTILSSVAAGTRVAFAPGTYTLSGPLTLAADSIHIDAMKATFIQTAWQQPGFDAIGRNGCLFDIGMVQWSGTRGGQGTSYRGSAGYCSGAGVWINRDRNYVRNLRTSGMPVGVFLSSWNGVSANDRVGVLNRLGNIECDNYNFGVLYAAQDGLVIDDIYGHDDLDDSVGSNPTHVIYGSAVTSFRATGGEFKSVRAKNNLTGQPVQVKFHDNLHIGSIQASNSKGLLNIIDSNDFKIDSYNGLALTANGGQGAITMQRSVTNSQRSQFGAGFVQLAANVDERAVNIISDDGIYNSITVETNHSGSIVPATAGGEILVRGSRNTLRKPKLRALGGAIPGLYVGFGELANGTLIDGPELSGVLSGVKVSSSSTGVTVNYDPAAQSIASGGAFFDTNSGVESVQSSTVPPLTLSTLGDHGILATLASAQPTAIANSAIQVKVTPRRTITVSSLTWWSFTASGNYDIAIVDDQTGTVLWSKGSTTWPAAGKITETVTGSPKMVAGRVYRLVFSADNATGAFRGVSAQITGIDQRLDGSTVSSIASTAFPIPTPTLAVGSAGSTRIPLIIVGGV